MTDILGMIETEADKNTLREPLRVFVIAGEASGDLLGANLMRAIKAQKPDATFTGIGGKNMQAEGLESLFPMEELSVMGLAEVLPRLFKIMSRIRLARKTILKTKPHVVVTIDSPDFCFRVVKQVKARTKSIPCVHYVAPSVWAWRPKRAEKVSKFLDHILTLLPFEPPYFTRHGLPATFVGHPIVEKLDNRGDGTRFREKYGLKANQPVFCMLPGSRMSELSRLLDKFSETADIVLRSRHQAVIVIPTLPHLKPHIEKFFVGKGINPVVVTDDTDKYDSFAAGTAALAASGTVTLELAMADTPHIIAYKLNPISAWAAKHLIKTPYVNLINILLRRPVVPELLLEDCEPQPMSRALLRLLDDREARSQQLMDFREALIKIGLGDPQTPGEKAAATVIGVIERHARLTAGA
ncbi:MAG: lipid-A-disaccharide synthase [Bdellovibrionales bacterium]|jgi:lipid-A-disaccharide synthase|nr:lipid-A-disaccharide synthase [Bdellovibrionales bacterium]